MIRNDIVNIEPFKTTMVALSHRRRMSTKELAKFLQHGGVAYRTNEKDNDDILRSVLLKWAVRCRLVSYSTKNDSWSIPTGHN